MSNMEVRKLTKNLLLSTSLFCLLAMGNTVSASTDQVTLTVVGEVIPGSCTPSLDNGSKIDYGSFPRTTLTKTSNQLGVKNINLSISCSAAAVVALYATDNRKTSIADGISVEKSWVGKTTVTDKKSLFGLGTTKDGEQIGAFSLGIDYNNMVFDTGTTKTLIKTDNVKADPIVWRSNSDGAIVDHDSTAGSWIAMTPGTPSTTPFSFKTATIPLIVSAAVRKYSAMTITEPVKLDGNVTLSLVYL
ncbi:DUF1120 domain-containing protein [Escherichia coli]|uniref:DUF1120 domain-containing protein n=1 Tax=Escherichia coli TaxID=562 RepID=UPI00148EABE9|nr:DUF1120 domain-containing protein [Escherichia coli]QJU26257.1 DUF1120 domain-containing protein [Escherichia coli]HBE6261922.1 DUF1120 domain-containing protein [Escherichia coli]